MPSPDISVIIPTSGRKKELEECLGSLRKQVFTNFEVIVVAKNKDSFSNLNKDFPSLRILTILQEGSGLAAARNTGIKMASAKFVSFIDDDCIVSEGWLKSLLEAFNSSQDIGGVSGPTIIPEELILNRDILFFQNRNCNMAWKILVKFYNYLILENKPYSIGRIFKSGAFSLGSNYMDAAKIAEPFEVDYLEACNMSFRKDILEKTGGFSLVYKGVGDWSEPDLAFRVRKRNFRLIFNPKAIVYHQVSKQRVYGEKGGDSYQRAKNFVHFYFQWIKPDTAEKLFRFSLNLLFINLYWAYKFLQAGNINWLLGIKGTFSGLFKEMRL